MTVLARWSCIALALLATAGCRHSKPVSNPYVHGRPPRYEMSGEFVSRVALQQFVTQVRQAQAQALIRPARPVQPTMEGSSTPLRGALARLASRPTSENERRVGAEYARLGIRDLALDHYTAALALDARDSVSYDMRARIWREAGFPGLGLGDAYRAIHFSPRSATPYNTLGTLFQRMGRYADARTMYGRALSIEPKAAYALSNLCALALAQGRPGEASAACREALDVDPTLAVARRNLAMATAMMADADVEAQHARH